MTAEDVARKLPFWDKLTEEEKEYTSLNTVVRSFKKGTMLQGCEETCLGMIQIISGSVRVLMISDEGREITLFRLNPGDSCVLSASCVLSQITFETHMIASVDTEVSVVNCGAFAHLMDNNLNVRCFAYELATERFSTVVWVLQQIIFEHFDQRLAVFLLNQCEKTGQTEIQMTQETIAQEVNTAREVVARMLKQFAQDNLIEIRRGAIVIKDAKGLQSIA